MTTTTTTFFKLTCNSSGTQLASGRAAPPKIKTLARVPAGTAAMALALAAGVAAHAGEGDGCPILTDFLPDTGHPVASLFDIDVIAPDDIWAVGRSKNDVESFSLTMHYDGTSWSIIPSPSPDGIDGEAAIWLADVDFYSSALGYAAGDYQGPFAGAGDNFAIEWNGSAWTQLEIPGVSQFGNQGFLLEAVEAIDPNNVWFGGQWNPVTSGSSVASMIHYDGSSFEVYELPRDPELTTAAHRIRAIAALGPNDIWAAGSAGGSAVAVGRNYVARWDGSDWAQVMTPHFGFGEILRDIVAIAPDDVWVCGQTQLAPPEGGPVITEPLFMHWDGSSWTRYPSPEFADDLVAFASDDIYGAEADKLVHWDGSEWSVVATLPSGDDGFINFAGIDAAFGSEIVIVGAHWYYGGFVNPLAARYDPQCEDDGLQGDLNEDQTVDVSDLLMLLAEWGTCPDVPAPCPADLDNNGTVSVLDLLLLLSNWG